MTDEARKEAAIRRGNDLLLPLNLSVDRIQRLALNRNKFPNAAAAKQWVVNHGFGKRSPVTTRFDFVFEVSVPTDFEEGTLHAERITPDIEAVVGEPNQVEESKPVVVEETPERKILEVQTGVWGGHTHTAKFDDQAGNGRTGPPSDGSDEHSHEIIGFQLQAADGHTHTMKLPDMENSRESRSIIACGVRRQGELWQVAKQDGKEDEVRMFGIVSKPEVPDAEGSVISEDEIRQANDLFMREFQTIGFMHQKAITEKVQILQNVVAPVDFEFPIPDGTTKRIAKGTWYQELYSNEPEIVSAVREGRLTGLSIGGFAKRVPVDDQKEVEQMVTKVKVEKADGDPIKERLVNLRVEEVSLVDAAANEEEWFIVKRLEKAVPSADATNEEKRAAQKARSEKYGVEALDGEGENLTFPSGEPTSEADYGDPVNLKYQMGDEAHARNARARFKQAADTYSQTKSKRVVHERIVRRELQFGVDVNFDPDDPLDQLLPSDLKDRLTAALASKQEKNMKTEQAKVEKGDAVAAAPATAGAGTPAVEVNKSDESKQKEVEKAAAPAPALDTSALDKVAKTFEDALDSFSKKIEVIGEISKSVSDLSERIGKIEGKLDEHGEAIGKAAVLKAAAKGESVPEATEAAAPVAKEAPTSLWTGSAIAAAIQRQKRN